MQFEVFHSGILGRADLARAARELGLGLRLAERSYTLRALLGQDREATLAWLAGEALRATGALRVEQPFAPVTGFWRERAATSAALLGDLSQAAQEAAHVG